MMRQSRSIATRTHPNTVSAETRHNCASQLYLTGMDLLAVQELLGHEWVSTTMRYVHVSRDHVASAWVAGQARAADRLRGLATSTPTGR